jgi:hypothetical protein
MTPPRFVGLRRPRAGCFTNYTNYAWPDRQGGLADPAQGATQHAENLDSG